MSKLVYSLVNFKGLITSLYRGDNLVTKYHGHPSGIPGVFSFQSDTPGFFRDISIDTGN